jgi:hypothetical protein
MTTQDQMRELMHSIQAEIQAHGVAKIKAEKPVQKHRSLYKAFQRYGWKSMRLAHDDRHVFVSLRSVR